MLYLSKADHLTHIHITIYATIFVHSTAVSFKTVSFVNRHEVGANIKCFHTVNFNNIKVFIKKVTLLDLVETKSKPAFAYDLWPIFCLVLNSSFL